MTIRISLTMIVKNEAATLGRCLTSVRDLADEIIVVDTGSSDNTKDIARQFDGRIFDLPWPDSFAAARNESLRHAAGQWLLWLDADEYFDDANRGKLRQLLSGLGEEHTAYVIRQRSAAANGSATLVGQVRLFRNHPAIRWDYRVHEQILPGLKRAGHVVHNTDIAIEHSGYLDPTLRHQKLERNLRLLHLDMADRPNDAFTLFNLGWAFADLGRSVAAIPLLEHSLQHSHNADSITPEWWPRVSSGSRPANISSPSTATWAATAKPKPTAAPWPLSRPTGMSRPQKKKGSGVADIKDYYSRYIAPTSPDPFFFSGRNAMP